MPSDASTAHPARSPAHAPASPADIERWLAALALTPSPRTERDGIVAWDLELDGRRRFDLRVTLILDPALGLICWAHLAPPLGDSLRKSYRSLLTWNDDFPFAKFAVAEDGRPILSVEIASRHLDEAELGLALARIVGVADRLLEQTAGWLWIGGRLPAGYGERTPRNPVLLERHAARLPELFGP